MLWNAAALLDRRMVLLASLLLAACGPGGGSPKASTRPVDEEAALVAEVEAGPSAAKSAALAAVRHQRAARVLADPAALASRSAMEEATARAVSATELEPDAAAHWHLRGVLYNRLSEWDERAVVMAEAALNRAVELNPGLAEAWVDLAGLHAVNLREQNALHCFERAIEESPALASPAVVGVMCTLYTLAGEEDRGRDFFQEAAAKTPDAPALGVGLAMLLRATGDEEGAVNEAEAVATLVAVGTPEHEYATRLLAEWRAGKP